MQSSIPGPWNHDMRRNQESVAVPTEPPRRPKSHLNFKMPDEVGSIILFSTEKIEASRSEETNVIQLICVKNGARTHVLTSKLFLKENASSPKILLMNSAFNLIKNMVFCHDYLVLIHLCSYIQASHILGFNRC